MDSQHSFHFADYIVFGLTIAISIGIGIFYAFSGGRQRTTSEFLVGNRQMSVLPVAISLMVSFESSIMMLGVPAEIYMFGIQWFWGNIGFFFANLLSIKIMVPLIHPLPITSAYEYLELRFKSHAVRLLGTTLGMLSYAVYMGVVLFGPAIALEAVTGLPLWSSIVVVATAAVIYTSIGGIKAVIWTDVFQSFVMFAGMFAVLIRGTISIGGVSKTWEIANKNGRINIFNFDPDPMIRHSFWNLLFGSIIRGMGLAFNQSSVQRIISIPTVKQAKRVMWITTPAFLVTLGLAAVEGIVAYAYYDAMGCDPLASKKIRDPNQVIPFMVMDIFKGIYGMPGLFLASLFSASLRGRMRARRHLLFRSTRIHFQFLLEVRLLLLLYILSIVTITGLFFRPMECTLSSGLSSLSALLWTDMIKPHTKPMSERNATIIAKVSVVVFGIFAIGIAFIVSLIGGTLTQIATTIISAFAGPLTGLFFLGCFVPFANAKGAMIGGITSTLYCFWFAFGKTASKGVKRTPPLPPAPTDMCIVSNMTGIFDSMVSNSSMLFNNDSTSNYITTSLPIQEIEPQGLDKMYSLSYLLISLFGIFLVIIIGSIVSLITGPVKVEDRDPRYLISLFDELFCFIPESWRKYLRCGVDYSKRKDAVEMVDTKDNIYRYTEVIDGKEFNNHGDADLNHLITTFENHESENCSNGMGMNHDKKSDAVNKIDTEIIENNGTLPIIKVNDDVVIFPLTSNAENDKYVPLTFEEKRD